MPLSAEDRALRAELTEARFAIQRQLEVLRSPFSGRTAVRSSPDTRQIVRTLEQQLKEIEEALADLDG